MPGHLGDSGLGEITVPYHVIQNICVAIALVAEHVAGQRFGLARHGRGVIRLPVLNYCRQASRPGNARRHDTDRAVLDSSREFERAGSLGGRPLKNHVA
jgi:hypothetical protein